MLISPFFCPTHPPPPPPPLPPLPGSYGMLGVANTPCLQGLSDAVVNATSPFLDPSAKSYIPSWVYSLPPAERDQKIALIHEVRYKADWVAKEDRGGSTRAASGVCFACLHPCVLTSINSSPHRPNSSGAQTCSEGSSPT